MSRSKDSAFGDSLAHRYKEIGKHIWRVKSINGQMRYVCAACGKIAETWEDLTR